MLKQLKPDRLYFIINIDESYAPRIFEVLKEEQTKKVNGRKVIFLIENG